MCLTNNAPPARLRSGISPRSPNPLISHLLWRLLAVAGDPAGDGSHGPPAWGEPPGGRGAGARKLAPGPGSRDGREPSRASEAGPRMAVRGGRARVRGMDR